jgi:transposase
MSTPHSAATAATENGDPTIWRVDDALWATLESILKSEKRRKTPGRPRRHVRAIFDGLIWLARTGRRWAALPRELGPKSTVHGRFREGVKEDELERGWAVLLADYEAAIGLDWSWLAAGGCIGKAPFGKRGLPALGKERAATPPTAASPAPSATS